MREGSEHSSTYPVRLLLARAAGFRDLNAMTPMRRENSIATPAKHQVLEERFDEDISESRQALLL